MTSTTPHDSSVIGNAPVVTSTSNVRHVESWNDGIELAGIEVDEEEKKTTARVRQKSEIAASSSFSSSVTQSSSSSSSSISASVLSDSSASSIEKVKIPRLTPEEAKIKMTHLHEFVAILQQRAPASNDSLESESDFITKQVAAAKELRQICRIQPVSPIQEVIDSGIVPRLIELLDTATSIPLLIELTWIMIGLAYSDLSCSLIAKLGVVPHLIKHIHAGRHEEVVLHSIWSLANIAVSSVEEHRNQILMSKIETDGSSSSSSPSSTDFMTSLILPRVQNPSNLGLQHEAMCLLANMFYHKLIWTEEELKEEEEKEEEDDPIGAQEKSLVDSTTANEKDHSKEPVVVTESTSVADTSVPSAPAPPPPPPAPAATLHSQLLIVQPLLGANPFTPSVITIGFAAIALIEEAIRLRQVVTPQTDKLTQEIAHLQQALHLMSTVSPSSTDAWKLLQTHFNTPDSALSQTDQNRVLKEAKKKYSLAKPKYSWKNEDEGFYDPDEDVELEEKKGDDSEEKKNSKSTDEKKKEDAAAKKARRIEISTYGSKLYTLSLPIMQHILLTSYDESMLKFVGRAFFYLNSAGIEPDVLLVREEKEVEEKEQKEKKMIDDKSIVKPLDDDASASLEKSLALGEEQKGEAPVSLPLLKKKSSKVAPPLVEDEKPVTSSSSSSVTSANATDTSTTPVTTEDQTPVPSPALLHKLSILLKHSNSVYHTTLLSHIGSLLSLRDLEISKHFFDSSIVAHLLALTTNEDTEYASNACWCLGNLIHIVSTIDMTNEEEVNTYLKSKKFQTSLETNVQVRLIGLIRNEDKKIDISVQAQALWALGIDITNNIRARDAVIASNIVDVVRELCKYDKPIVVKEEKKEEEKKEDASSGSSSSSIPNVVNTDFQVLQDGNVTINLNLSIMDLTQSAAVSISAIPSEEKADTAAAAIASSRIEATVESKSDAEVTSSSSTSNNSSVASSLPECKIDAPDANSNVQPSCSVESQSDDSSSSSSSESSSASPSSPTKDTSKFEQPDEDILRHATFLFARLAHGSPSVPYHHIQPLIPLCAEILRRESIDETLLNVCYFYSYLTITREDEVIKEIVDCGVVERLIEISSREGKKVGHDAKDKPDLEQADENIDVYLPAINVMNDILARRNPLHLKTFLQSTTIIRVFLELLYHKNPLMRTNACQCLGNVLADVADATSTRKEVAKSYNISQRLVEVVRDDSDITTRQNATWALGNSIGHDNELRDLAFAGGILDVILPLCHEGIDDVLHQHISFFLSKLCHGSPSPKLEVIAPLLPILREMILKSKTEYVLEYAIWSLCYLSDDLQNERVEAIVQLGVINKLVAFLSKLHVQIQHTSALCLGNILSSGNSSWIDKILYAGGARKLFPLIHHGDVLIRKDAYTCFKAILIDQVEKGDGKDEARSLSSSSSSNSSASSSSPSSSSNRIQTLIDIGFYELHFTSFIQWDQHGDAAWIFIHMLLHSNEAQLIDALESGMLEPLSLILNGMTNHTIDVSEESALDDDPALTPAENELVRARRQLVNNKFLLTIIHACSKILSLLSSNTYLHEYHTVFCTNQCLVHVANMQFWQVKEEKEKEEEEKKKKEEKSEVESKEKKKEDKKEESKEAEKKEEKQEEKKEEGVTADKRAEEKKDEPAATAAVSSTTSPNTSSSSTTKPAASSISSSSTISSPACLALRASYSTISSSIRQLCRTLVSCHFTIDNLEQSGVDVNLDLQTTLQETIGEHLIPDLAGMCVQYAQQDPNAPLAAAMASFAASAQAFVLPVADEAELEEEFIDDPDDEQDWAA